MSIRNPIAPLDDDAMEQDRERSLEDERDYQVEDTDVRELTPASESAARPTVEASYLPTQASEQTNERWQGVQAQFVDDPRKSVAEAHQLVSEVMQRIVDAFTQERDSLEQQWSKGDSVSTEDLRLCLQRYRAFFDRLLPSAEGLGGSTP